MIKELVYRNRSYRRFREAKRVSRELLLELVDLARMSPSGRNIQSLKYYLSADVALNERVYPLLAWAGYLKDWDGPVEGERPSAYIVMLEDTLVAQGMVHDQGIAAQSILLGAVEKGLGGCIIASVKKEALSKVLGLPNHLKVALVIALGEPLEEVVVDPIGPDGDIKYWRDDSQVHHLPKRSLKEIVVG
ncbi:MAG: nitroreductase family protein [Bacteroidales bacterium]|nr:nitroreductase family protein [Bacteroidales bacterium]MBN2748362.1 nitroreductase family protein [Bacteroidales bacterium]